MSFLIGFLVGRWWAVVLALPAAVVARSVYSFEGFSDTETAVLFGIAAAGGLLAGTAARKMLGAFLRSRQEPH